MSSTLVGRDRWGSQIGSPAMSVPSWRNRHSACRQIKINNKKSSSPAMSYALVARPSFGLLSISSPDVYALVGLDCSWLAVPRELAQRPVPCWPGP